MHALPRVSYLGIDFACNGAWDMCISERYTIIVTVLRRKVISYIVISNRDINLSAWSLLLLHVCLV